MTIIKHNSKPLTALSAQARQFLLPTSSIRNTGACKSQTNIVMPYKKKSLGFQLGFSEAALVPYLSDVACGIHKCLKVLVADLVLVHVEAVNVDSPGRALPILLDFGLVGAHGEHPSWNGHHLHSKHHPKGWESEGLRSPLAGFTPPAPHLCKRFETAFSPTHLGKQQTTEIGNKSPLAAFLHELWVMLVLQEEKCVLFPVLHHCQGSRGAVNEFTAAPQHLSWFSRAAGMNIWQHLTHPISVFLLHCRSLLLASLPTTPKIHTT